MLRSAKTDASSTEADRVVRFFRSIGVGLDFDTGILISPFQDFLEVRIISAFLGFDSTIIDASSGTIEGDDISLFVFLSTEFHCAFDFIDL